MPSDTKSDIIMNGDEGGEEGSSIGEQSTALTESTDSTYLTIPTDPVSQPVKFLNEAIENFRPFTRRKTVTALSKHLAENLGPGPWNLIPFDHQMRMIFLRNHEHLHLGPYALCCRCALYHEVRYPDLREKKDTLLRAKQRLQRQVKRCCRLDGYYQSPISIYRLFFTDVQQIMSLHRHGDPGRHEALRLLGVSQKEFTASLCLDLKSKSCSISTGVEMSTKAEARVRSQGLFLRFDLEWRIEGDTPYSLRSLAICPHRQMREETASRRLTSQIVNCKMNHLSSNDCKGCRGIKRCLYCPVEVEFSHDDDCDEKLLRVVVWTQLGNGTSPLDPIWLASRYPDPYPRGWDSWQHNLCHNTISSRDGFEASAEDQPYPREFLQMK